MNLESLIPIANEFIASEAGKKIFGLVDVQDSLNKITELRREISSSQAELSGSTTEESNTSSGRTKVGQFISSSKAKIKKLSKQNIPRFETFETVGRIFDKQTNEPLEGVNVIPGVAINEKVGAPEKVELSTGNNEVDKYLDPEIIVNPNDFVYVPIKAALTGNSKDGVKTNKQGKFKIFHKVLVLGEDDKAILSPGLIYQKPEYAPTSISVLNGDNTIKTSLNTKGLTNIPEAAKDLQDQYEQVIDQAQAAVNLVFLTGVEKLIILRSQSVNKVVDTIKSKLLPLAIGMLIAFGITKLTEKDQKVCPTKDQLKDIIRKRNRTIKQLNQIFQTIVVNTTLAVAFAALASSLRGIRLSIDALPFPQAVGTPPAKDFGGLVFAQPYSTTAKLQRIDDLLEELEKDNKSLNKETLIALVMLVAGTATVLALLQGIDEMAQECSEDVLDLEEVNRELLLVTNNTTENLETPVVSNLNGFTFDILTDNTNPVGTLKRRFAVAKNKRGVIQLRGESSFSASDQVLIDELIFYIQQNDLKAF
tara:strand:+ start:1747 stop:3351 length:1605 start_codon:yes stop_codon:yes gene_type:complete